MTIFLFDPHNKEFFFIVKETEAQRSPFLPKIIHVASGTAQHLWLILKYHRGLYSGLSFREKAQIDVNTQHSPSCEEKETLFEPYAQRSARYLLYISQQCFKVIVT